ncbi:MAG: hypothetical protein HY286_00740 [Planctomycetes bacterium]|nr:hypothetical protein [Planctomycetota bacterium]
MPHPRSRLAIGFIVFMIAIGGLYLYLTTIATGGANGTSGGEGVPAETTDARSALVEHYNKLDSARSDAGIDRADAKAAAGALVTFMFLDAITGAPVERIESGIWEDGGEFVRHEDGDPLLEGVLQFRARAIPETVLFACSAPGYASGAGSVRIEGDHYNIILQPLGELKIAFQNEDGTASPDIPAPLIQLPTQPGLVSARETDARPRIQIHWARDSILSDLAVGRKIHNSRFQSYMSDVSFAYGVARKEQNGIFKLEPETVFATPGRPKEIVPGSWLWKSLTPGEGYRWRAPSTHSMEMNPPSEANITEVRNGFQISGPIGESSRLSGPFEILPGERKVITVSVYSSTSVSGVLAGAADADTSSETGHRVELIVSNRQFSKHKNPDNSGLVIFEEERKLVPARDGSFLFTGLKPGTKELTAAWLDYNHKFRFVNIQFELAPGEKKDLGSLAAAAGFAISVEVQYRDGTSGELLNSKELFAGVPPPTTIALLSNISREVPSEENLSVPVELRADAAYTMTGLRGGDWQLRFLQSPRFESLTAIPEVKTSGDGLVSFKIPGTERVTLYYDVFRKCKITLSANSRRKAGNARAVAMIFPRDFHGDDTAALGRKSGADSDCFESTLNLRQGRYEVIVILQSEAGGESVNLAGGTEFTVESGPEKRVEVALNPGVRIRGSLHDAQGSPVPATTVYAALKSANPNVKNLLAFASVLTDSRGEFLIESAPPNHNIYFLHSAQFVTTGGPGSEASVQLIRSEK